MKEEDVRQGGRGGDLQCVVAAAFFFAAADDVVMGGSEATYSESR